MYIALVKAEEKIYIVANDDFSVCGFETEREGLRTFEDMYNRHHHRSYEGSMSAALYDIMFQPSIVKIKDVNDIAENIAAKEPHGVRLHAICGMIDGITTQENALELWKKGKKPRLITY